MNKIYCLALACTFLFAACSKETPPKYDEVSHWTIGTNSYNSDGTVRDTASNRVPSITANNSTTASKISILLPAFPRQATTFFYADTLYAYDTVSKSFDKRAMIIASSPTKVYTSSRRSKGALSVSVRPVNKDYDKVTIDIPETWLYNGRNDSILFRGRIIEP